ncbi:MAG: hypothetical protein AAGF97_01060, partial [Planctomycetota bacterium]
IFRWLGMEFIEGYREQQLGISAAKKNDETKDDPETEPLTITSDLAKLANDGFARFQIDAPSCDNCGSITVRSGNCYLCHNCGQSMGCS